jgi:hypothetical protein
MWSLEVLQTGVGIIAELNNLSNTIQIPNFYITKGLRNIFGPAQPEPPSQIAIFPCIQQAAHHLGKEAEGIWNISGLCISSVRPHWKAAAGTSVEPDTLPSIYESLLSESVYIDMHVFMPLTIRFFALLLHYPRSHYHHRKEIPLSGIEN